MPIKVMVPSMFDKLTQGKLDVEAAGSTVKDVLDDLSRQYPGVNERIRIDGKLHARIACFVNEEDIRFLQGEETPVKDGDTVSLIPSIAGG
jgi:molybdopterin synthase sulfur carrier subunit